MVSSFLTRPKMSKMPTAAGNPSHSTVIRTQNIIDRIKQSCRINCLKHCASDDVCREDYPDKRFGSCPGLLQDYLNRRYMVAGHLHDESYRISGDGFEGDPSQQNDESYVKDVQCHSPPDVDEGSHQA